MTSTTLCKFGASCKRQSTCRFVHPTLTSVSTQNVSTSCLSERIIATVEAQATTNRISAEKQKAVPCGHTSCRFPMTLGDKGSALIIFSVKYPDHILVVKEREGPRKNTWGPPSGKLDKKYNGCHLKNAAAELFEETGYDARELGSKFNSLFQMKNGPMRIAHFGKLTNLFIARDDKLKFSCTKINAILETRNADLSLPWSMREVSDALWYNIRTNKFSGNQNAKASTYLTSVAEFLITLAK